MARRWKRKKLAEIEINGFKTAARSHDTVTDAFNARLAAHKHLGRSGRQQLEWLKASDFGKKKLGHVDKWRIQRRIEVMSMKPGKLSAVLS
ncbi:hypothetical protein [Paracoccus beibuensis]|uniref:hypothetical protein n=1 Tax=Paracoccus beibuensis TaxID=547602 RepID=UPI0022403CEB|nr:hypothetical protein [Paracoccus beibuensis]